ncbi:hypothetical protein [Herbidospora mongoliensis]|uniref:hypothetical protein n=1 Tax=Herbidospora mongoliensis TaxID=688067 RepID=UPI00082CD72C|nr:hypothetical protein [Herbidospora mongoliensis]
MKPIELWRYEARRAGLPALLGPPLLASAILLLAVFGGALGSAEGNTRRLLLSALEAGVPLLAGVAAATLPGRDATAELRLTIPGGYRPALIRRLAVTLGSTALSAVTVSSALMLSGWWDFAYSGPAGQLVWLAPSVWLAALGFCCAAALGGTVPATSIVAAVWVAEQLSSGPLRLFATTTWPDAEGWPLNRAALLATALPLVATGWLLLGNSERVLRGEPG